MGGQFRSLMGVFGRCRSNLLLSIKKRRMIEYKIFEWHMSSQMGESILPSAYYRECFVVYFRFLGRCRPYGSSRGQ